ncbi:MAG: type II toxin-antitoxin system RelE/ParE family toxin [Solirubrobacterales bacterium]
MPRTQAVYYRSPDGSEPVNDFIDSLPVRRQVAVDNQIDRLNGLSPSAPPLPFPHSSQVKGALRELRCHFGSTAYRVLYRRSDNLFLLLHIFEKSSPQIPAADVAVAEKRWVDFKARMDAPKKAPPRAAGHDAP